MGCRQFGGSKCDIRASCDLWRFLLPGATSCGPASDRAVTPAPCSPAVTRSSFTLALVSRHGGSRLLLLGMIALREWKEGRKGRKHRAGSKCCPPACQPCHLATWLLQPLSPASPAPPLPDLALPACSQLRLFHHHVCPPRPPAGGLERGHAASSGAPHGAPPDTSWLPSCPGAGPPAAAPLPAPWPASNHVAGWRPGCMPLHRRFDTAGPCAT